MGGIFSTEAFSDGPYIREQKLGAGAFGEVFKVRHVETREVYALKVITCKKDDDLTNVLGEMKALSKLTHQNIMKLYEAEFKQEKRFEAELWLLFEYCSGGNLSKRLERYSPKYLSLKWMRQMADAVSYLHSKNLVHRDLKPDNILLTSRDDIKVGDFGLSREFVTMKREDQTWEMYYMANGCGTLFYLAPEVFSDHYTEKADVFALGLLFYAIEERTFLEVSGTKCYGVFIERDGAKVPLGLQMYIDMSRLVVPFAKSDERLARIIGSALLFDQKRRPDVATIKEKLNWYQM